LYFCSFGLRTFTGALSNHVSSAIKLLARHDDFIASVVLATIESPHHRFQQQQQQQRQGQSAGTRGGFNDDGAVGTQEAELVSHSSQQQQQHYHQPHQQQQQQQQQQGNYNYQSQMEASMMDTDFLSPPGTAARRTIDAAVAAGKQPRFAVVADASSIGPTDAAIVGGGGRRVGGKFYTSSSSTKGGKQARQQQRIEERGEEDEEEKDEEEEEEEGQPTQDQHIPASNASSQPVTAYRRRVTHTAQARSAFLSYTEEMNGDGDINHSQEDSPGDSPMDMEGDREEAEEEGLRGVHRKGQGKTNSTGEGARAANSVSSGSTNGSTGMRIPGSQVTAVAALTHMTEIHRSGANKVKQNKKRFLDEASDDGF
jgi:hypothetical protein